mmetsp:Transcript_6268/g.10204  ORF Transcript_6268/g.10204 Transcript_6268/m.10204 type:complete len:225 (-) Transcript_6268:14-688(-)
MAQEGGHVHICSRRQKNVDDAVQSFKAKGLTVHGHVCNVGKPSERAAMLQKIKDMHGGRLDVLVPNAASSTHFGQQLDITEKAYDKMWDLNVKSTFFLIKESIDMLRESAANKGAANILIVSSVTGQNPNFTIGVYGATKAALECMVKGLAQELIGDEIRVNGIAPGLIKTDFSSNLWKSSMVNPASVGESHHIGSVVACICSKGDGGFMNGETYQVHGGFAKM